MSFAAVACSTPVIAGAFQCVSFPVWVVLIQQSKLLDAPSVGERSVATRTADSKLEVNVPESVSQPNELPLFESLENFTTR